MMLPIYIGRPLNQVFIMATKKPNILYIMADQMAAPLLCWPLTMTKREGAHSGELQ
jgi:hypothetical protein